MKRHFVVGTVSVFLMIFLLGIFGCTRGEFDGDVDVDTWENPKGDGPEILFLPDEEPALMPWPNDIATIEDPSTLTGRRINVGKEGETDLNKVLRRKLRELDGFGLNQSITVSFGTEVELTTISNDQVYILNIQKDSPRYGELHDVDFQTDYFPFDLLNPKAFFPNDTKGDLPDIMFAEGNRVKYYEDETNTMLMRPLTPLASSCEYAIVLLKGITDVFGNPIRPPEYFEYITFPNMLEQTETAVMHLNKHYGVNVDDIAFVWSFTTQTVAEPLEALRAGIWGKGQFGYLADDYLPQISVIHQFGTETDGQDDPYVLGAGFFELLFSVLVPLIPEAEGLPIDEMLNMTNIDYLVSGTYTTPLFLQNEDDGYFHWNWRTGEAKISPEEVPFFISVPKPTEANNFAQPPYPVVIFQHANVRSRLDSITLANALAVQGMATIGIDAAEHGPETILWGLAELIKGIVPAPPGLGDTGIKLIVKLLIKIMYPSIDLKGLSEEELIDILFDEDTFFGSALHGRSKDEDGDGIIEQGNSFYSADIFRTKAISQQTLVDLFLVVKILKHLGTDWDGDGVLSREEGDFNLDGVLDVGGPDLPIRFCGMSLGSIIGAPFIAIEPEIKTAVLNVPGGVLTDILQRNNIPNVNREVRSDLMGPVVVGRPMPNGQTALTFTMQPLGDDFAKIGVYPGARAVLTNLDQAETRSKNIADDGNFAVSVAADVGDWLRLEIVNEDGKVLEDVEWVQEFRGLGVERNTPTARGFIETAQWAADGVDPVNFAPFFRMYPRPGNEPKNVLLQMCMPDTAIPVSAGIAVARAAGFITPERQAKLKELGIFDYGYSLFVQANLPYESRDTFGWRIHPGYNHEYMLAPRNEPNSVMYSFASKNQAALFLKNDGAWIEDNLHVLVPAEYYVEGY